MASFTFTAETVLYSSTEGALGAVEMPWLLFVPLCDCRGQMGRRKVARTHMMLPNSPTWHIDVSNCFWAHLAPFWLQDEETFLGSLLSPSPLAVPSASGAHSGMAL